MGLWIKNADGTIEKAAGGGGGGTFDGDHVLTGDPLNPPAGLGAGQLLWDGVEGGGSGGGGPHDHDDYLPLEGGIVTGDLQVSGQMSVFNGTSSAPTYSFWNDRTVGLYLVGFGKAGFAGNLQVNGQTLASSGTAALPGMAFTSSAWTGFYYGDGAVHTSVQGVSRFQVSTSKATVTGDLQVDGSLQVNGDYVAGNYHRGIQNGTANWPIYSFNPDPYTGMYLHSVSALGFSAGTTLSAIFTNTACQHYLPVRASIGSPAAPSFSFIDATGLGFYLKSTATQTIGISGRLEGSVNFRIADDIDTTEVLERAETATMPVVDDDGVVTADAEVESVTVNEVVTALLAKVKELSARIEELEGN